MDINFREFNVFTRSDGRIAINFTYEEDSVLKRCGAHMSFGENDKTLMQEILSNLNVIFKEVKESK